LTLLEDRYRWILVEYLTCKRTLWF